MLLCKGCQVRKIKKANHIRFALEFGGDTGIRTPGLRIANASLYQLSYIPKRMRAL